MSVRLMTAVFDRYPTGAGEFTLALALADNAHDDGSHIFPTVATLAQKTRQSVRAVQYQLRRMEEIGWLVLVGAGDGGCGRPREYRISPEWIKGGELPSPQKGANSAPATGATIAPVRVQNEAEKGATIAPAIEPQEPSENTNPPSPPCRGVTASSSEAPEAAFDLVGDARDAGPSASAKDRRGYAQPVGIDRWLADCRAAGVQAIPPDDAVFAYCAGVGLTREVLGLHWWEFVRRRRQRDKRQKSWEQTFRNSVEGNWYRLWVITADGRCELTSLGRQVQAARDAAQREAA